MLTAQYSLQGSWYFYRSSTYAASGLLFLLACLTSTLLPISAEDIHSWSRCTMFSLRYSLFAVDNLLLGVTSLLFNAHLLFGSCFSLVGSSLSPLTPCCLSLAGSMLTTCNWLFPLAAHGLPFAVLGVRHSSVANRRALVDYS